MADLTDYLHGYKVRSFPNLEPPAMKAPVIDQGSSGTASYTYAAAFVTICGETVIGSPVTITNGPDILSPSDRLKLQVESIPPGAQSIKYFKLTDGGFKLIGAVNKTIGYVHDTGQEPTDTLPSATNTSGRPDYLALGYHVNEYRQRQEGMDEQGIRLMADRRRWNTVFKDGDIIKGLSERGSNGNVKLFIGGDIYWQGFIHAIPEPTNGVTITGVGTEVVGIVPTPRWVSNSEDSVLRAHADEGSPPERAMEGADRLVIEWTWGVDQPGQIKILEYLDGEPKLITRTTQYSELENKIAQYVRDTVGDCTVRDIPHQMRPHATDPALMICAMGGAGKSYVDGYPLEFKATQSVVIPKGRDTKTVNNSILDAYQTQGGSALGTASEPFNVDGLNVKIRFIRAGKVGNWHTVTLSGAAATAAQVATQIAGAINIYPTSSSLISCQDQTGKLRMTAVPGLDMEIGAVASDAYTAIGISTGVYTQTGQRIYKMNNSFIKQTSDMQYLTEIIEQVTHDGSDRIDTLENENVQSILGASDSEADCVDGKWDYVLNEDYVKNGNAIDFKALTGNKPDPGTTYYVRYRYNRNATRGTRVRIRVTDAPILKGEEDGIDTIKLTGGTAVEVKSGNPASVSGDAKNVIRILRVNNSPGQSISEYDSYSLLKNATSLGFGNSEISWATAGAQGEDGDGQPVTGHTYYCTYEAWKTVVEGDFLDPGSYINDYDEIELATDGVTNLRDCIDFRTDGLRPIPEESARLDYLFYLGRWDKIALKSDRTTDTSDGWFFRIAGAPAEFPVAPANQTGAFSVKLLYIPPYTYSEKEVYADSLDTKLLKQQDLNELSIKVDRTQYTAAQSLALQVAVANNYAQEAQGIVAHSIIGQKEFDVTFDRLGLKHTAAIDTRERVIRLPVTEDGRTITVDEANSTGIKRVGKVICFDYEEYVWLSQPYATDIYPINPHETFGWVGVLGLDPEGDFWTDVDQIPALDINYDDQMAALARLDAENAERARQITWGAWRLNWDQSGGWAARTIGEGTGYHWLDTASSNKWGGANASREREGTYSSLVAERKLVQVGENILDVTALAYMRTQYPNGSPFYVGLEISGLEPNVDFAGSVDGVYVDLEPTGTTVAGSATYQGKSTIRCSAIGSATARFVMPAGITVGAKPVEVFKASNPDESYAISSFTSQGFRETRQMLVQGILSVAERTNVVSQTQWHYGDPLAQTFAVETGMVPISYITLFHANTPTLPVTVQVSATLNGYPTRDIYQTATLNPDDITPSDDSSVGTKYYFQNPIMYTPGEFSFKVICNDPNAKLWKCTMGGTDVLTGQEVLSQPYAGVMFMSPNDSTWVAEPTWDLKFEIGACNFVNSARIEFNTVDGIEASMLISAVTQFLPAGCNLHWYYKTNGSSEWISYTNGIDTELSAIATSCKIAVDATGVGTTFQLSESDAGIILLLNKTSGDAISHEMPAPAGSNKARFVVQLDTDGVNGAGTRSVYWNMTVDDGYKWFLCQPPVGFVPTLLDDGIFREWEFETPDEQSVTGASNTTPITISSPSNRFPDNILVTIEGVEGNTNANGTFRVVNSDANGFDLVDPVTGADVSGSGAYTTGGTIRMADFTNYRYWARLTTSSQAVSPKIRQPILGFVS